MAQLNDTLVNGDLRVNGKIYGIITSADSATNASNLGSTAASDFALKNGNYSSNGLIAKSASTAERANAGIWTEKSDDRTYRVAFSQDNKFYYSQQFNYNAGTQTLCAKNISSVNITGTVNGNLSGSAASALTSKSALSAGYATSAGAAPVASHNHNYQLSGNGTALYISAGVNLKPNGNIAISTAANTINISAKDTTYTSLNGINSTEFNALTSTSANSRNPNAHQLSSHTNFSTYFNGTSANTALTSKSALSAGSATQAGYLSKRSIGFSRTVAQGGDGKKWCRIASISISNFTTANVWGSSETELNIYTKAYGDDIVDRGKLILYCVWGHGSASSPTYSMKTNGRRGAKWLYWRGKGTSTSVSADSAVSAYTPFNGLKQIDIKVVATDTSVEWWLYNDVWDTSLNITESYSNNITLYGKDSPKTLGEFKTYLEDNRTQWDDTEGDGTIIDKALSAYGAYWVGKSDNRNYNVAFSLDNAFNYRNTLTFNPSSNTLSSTNITTVTLSGTTVKGATVSGTTVYGNTISAGKLTGTQFILVDGSATNNTVTAADKAAVNALDNPKIGFYNVGGDQKGYIIWTDYNNSNIWGNADSSFFGGTNITDGFVVTSDQLNSIFVSKNMSATNFKGVTISGTNITAATTVRGTNLSGTNISGASKTASIDNLINSAARAIPTVNNKTITITTGASPATASFTTNTAADKTITLGSMALKASGDYIPNSYSSSTASTFSGKASTAENANKGVWGAVTDNRNYPVAISLDSKFNYTTTTGANHIYFNPASGQLNVVSAVKIGGCQMKWNASTSALDFNF